MSHHGTNCRSRRCRDSVCFLKDFCREDGAAGTRTLDPFLKFKAQQTAPTVMLAPLRHFSLSCVGSSCPAAKWEGEEHAAHIGTCCARHIRGSDRTDSIATSCRATGADEIRAGPSWGGANESDAPNHRGAWTKAAPCPPSRPSCVWLTRAACLLANLQPTYSPRRASGARRPLPMPAPGWPFS